MGRKQTVNIAYLGSLIRQWDNNRDITHAMQIRLMKLLLGTGTTYFMDEQGRYPASNFNAISEAMGCHLPKKLVATVVESGAFAVERCEEADMNVYGIRYFASPLYYDKAEVKSKGETLKSTLKSRVNSSIINNTDNKSVLSERINEEVVDEFVEDTLTKRRYLFDDIMKQLKAPSNNFSQQFDQRQAEDVVNVLMRHTITKYFKANYERLAKMDVNARTAWLTNLLRSKYIKAMLHQTINICRASWRKAERMAVKRQQKQERSYNPLSQYEWMTEDGQRLYDNTLDRQVEVIPPDAPPRPGDNWRWSRMKHEWIEMKQRHGDNE